MMNTNMQLLQIVQEQVEKFDDDFVTIGRIEDVLRYSTKKVGYCEANLDTIKSFIISSHISFIESEISRKKGMLKEYEDSVLEIMEKESKSLSTKTSTIYQVS